MGTPSTISSGSLEATRDLLGLPGTGTDRTRMNDNGLKSFPRSGSNSTPNPVQKVNNWIKDLKRRYPRKSDSDSFSNQSKSTLDAMDGNGFHTDNGFMFVRCSFDKEVREKPESPPGSLYKYCAPFYDYLERCKNLDSREDVSFKNRPTLVRSKSVNDQSKTCFHYKSDKRRSEDDVMTEKSLDSPDSQKKQELCSYLQLMKPTDKKQVVMLQNRRSTRVKNLCLMKEKKELERKLKEEEKIVPNGHRIIDETEADEDLYEFPKPHFILKQIIDDFDNVNVSWMTTKQNAEEIHSMLKNQVKGESFLAEDQEVASILPNDEYKVPKLLEDCVYTITDFDLIADELIKTSKKETTKKNLTQTELKAINQLKALTSRKSKLISDIISSLRMDRNLKRHSTRNLHKNVKQRKFSRKLQVRKKSAKPNTKLEVVENNNGDLEVNSSFSIKGVVCNDIDMNDIEFKSLSREHQRSLLESRFPLIVNGDKLNQSLSSPDFLLSEPKLEFIKDFDVDLPEPETLDLKTDEFVVADDVFPENNEIVPEIVDCPADEPKNSENSKSDENTSEESDIVSKNNTISESMIEKPDIKCTPFNKIVEEKSLHRSLNTPKKKTECRTEFQNSPHSWTSDSPSQKQKKLQHSINVARDDGLIIKAFFVEYNLILSQELLVSFWTQTALGNVLGAQNMWIPKGSIPRVVMDNKCIFKESMEMVVSTETNVSYIELWMKEHVSDVRQRPVADVFAVVYFWKSRQNGLEKKALQLENINGFADDVQYSVLKSTPKIIVSWHSAGTDIASKKTFVHCYHLAADYQTVDNISEFESVEHYVSSLHNIEDCDGLVMGCGENKITLWNLEYGYVVATIAMTEIKTPLCTLWVKSDRGFLFTLQQCVDRELRLVAINGINHSWKKLASYVPPAHFDRLKGVCVENGIVVGFYDRGILCWNAQTGEPIVEELQSETEYISGKYIISVVKNRVNVRHAITHLLSPEDS